MNAKIGQNGSSLVSGPSGGMMPPKPTQVAPQTYGGLVGQPSVQSSQISTDYMSDAKDYEPTQFNPDILVNPKTGRVVYKSTGQDITDQVKSNPAFVHQLAQEQKEKEDKAQADQEKVLKAQHTIEMNRLKQQQDLNAQTLIGHTRAGLGLYRMPTQYSHNSRTGALIGTPGDVITR